MKNERKGISHYTESQTRGSSALRLRLGGRNDGGMYSSPLAAEFAYGWSEANPDSEQIEPIGAELHRRNSASVEQIKEGEDVAERQVRGQIGEGSALCCAAYVVSPPQPSPTGEGVRVGSEPNQLPNRISNLVDLGKKFCLPRPEKANTSLPNWGGTEGGVLTKKAAFTLAEVLITLGVIGVVAALTLPTLNAAISKKVRSEQIRTVKYKFTKATTKMASLGLIGPYNSTAAFVAELQKHLKIIKVCTSSNLRACWPYDTIILEDGKEYDVTKITTGKAFKMTSSDTADYTSPTVGIVTGDGTPMIISYNTKCEALDPMKTYTWSTEDNKPVSNATTSCVAAIFEVNGTRRPNKFREDVVAFNANGLGSSCAIELASGKCFTAPFTPTPMTRSECEAAVAEGKLGIKACYYSSDYWAGAVKQCGGTSNMPTMADLGTIASAIYDGNPSIGAKEDKSNLTYTAGTATSLGLPEPTFYLWSGEEGSYYGAYYRNFGPSYSDWYSNNRYNSGIQAVCLGD